MTDDEARALDRQVALALGYTEHVFDWAYGGDSDHIVKASCWSLPSGKHTYQGSLPHFSTDLKTAWTVVEAMRERGWWCVIKAYFSGTDCFVGFTPTGMTGWNGRPDASATATTLPEAICRAAVAALRQQTASSGKVMP